MCTADRRRRRRGVGPCKQWLRYHVFNVVVGLKSTPKWQEVRHSRLGAGNGCDEVAWEQLLHRDVREAFAASLIACDCVRQK
jgi:hypothetical protein